MRGLVILIMVVAAQWRWEGQAFAESARSLVARGNGLYAAGKFAEANKLYEEAATQDPGSPEVWYDLGNARYQLNDFKGAAEAYQQATTKGRDPELLSKSEFNLGNTAFREGEAMEGTDPQAAMQAFQESIGHFRAALERNAALKEAGRNLEVSKRRLQKIAAEMQRQQEAQQAEQAKQEEMAKELQQMAAAQQQMAGQSRDEAAKEEKDDQALEDQAAQQGAMQEKTKELRQQMGKTPAQQEAAQELQQAEGHQQEAEERLRDKRPEEAAKAQEEAAEALRQAEKQLAGQEEQQATGEQPKGEKQEAKSGSAEKKEAKEEKGKEKQAVKPQAEGAPGPEGQPPGAAEEAEPVDRTAQQLLDEERENARERRSQEAKSGEEAVDKDW